MAGFGILLIVFVAASVAVAVVLRDLVFDEARREAELHQPGAHAVEYDVRVGVDPAVARAALLHAGFESAAEMRDGRVVLLVGCPDEKDRAEVQDILEHVHAA